jgi:hypothetical protein
MSMFDYSNDYGYENYQRDHDWRDEQAYEHDMDMIRELQEDERRAAQYEETKEKEEDVRQLAQISVGGVYRYALDWLPETREIRAEVAQFPDGSPMYLWYPDNMGTMEVLSKLLNIPEDRISITGLKLFTEEQVPDTFDTNRWSFPHNTLRESFECEQWLFLNNNSWRSYAEDGTAMLINVEIACPNDCYDAACDGTNCEFKPVPRLGKHGIDGTQCDCSDCTLDHGLCSCGCGGNHQLHEEWLEEREKDRQAFVHETVNPPPSPTPLLEIEDDDGDSTSSVESAEEKESRLWSDFKLAMMVATLALMIGAYLCKVACF